MAKPKKLIPCRVCGKMFEPCSYCQQHSDVFRWRNFACSIECAKEYIASTEAYRAAQKEKAATVPQQDTEVVATPKKRGKKKSNVQIKDVNETVETSEQTEVQYEAPVVEEETILEVESIIETVEDTDGEVNDEIATDTENEEI